MKKRLNSSSLLSKGERLNWVSMDQAKPVYFDPNIKAERLTEKELSSIRQQAKDKLLVP